jgi:hypothetical protein
MPVGFYGTFRTRYSRGPPGQTSQSKKVSPLDLLTTGRNSESILAEATGQAKCRCLSNEQGEVFSSV